MLSLLVASNSVNPPLPVTVTVLVVVQVECTGKQSWKWQGQLCGRRTEAG